ncbi:MAG: hypothetical protein ACXVI9_09360 [Mucilaginibacter sp.]
MKKLLFTFAILAGTALSGFSQTNKSSSPSINNGIRFSLGADAGIPVGNIASEYDLGMGASVNCDFSLFSRLKLTVSAGYEALLINSTVRNISPSAPSSDRYIPLKGGLKYYFSENIYTEGQAGVAIYTSNGGDVSFAYSPGVGYTFDSGFEAGLRYEAWVKEYTLSQLAFRVAYRFK